MKTRDSMLDRAHEADRILCRKRLLDKTCDMSHRDRLFVEEMTARLETHGEKAGITPWELVWLRDLKKRHL